MRNRWLLLLVDRWEERASARSLRTYVGAHAEACKWTWSHLDAVDDWAREQNILRLEIRLFSAIVASVDREEYALPLYRELLEQFYHTCEDRVRSAADKRAEKLAGLDEGTLLDWDRYVVDNTKRPGMYHETSVSGARYYFRGLADGLRDVGKTGQANEIDAFLNAFQVFVQQKYGFGGSWWMICAALSTDSFRFFVDELGDFLKHREGGESA